MGAPAFEGRVLGQTVQEGVVACQGYPEGDHQIGGNGGTQVGQSHEQCWDQFVRFVS